MRKPSLEPALLDSPPDKPSHRPFPELAKILREQTGRILDEWRGRALFSMPELGKLSVKEFQDDIASILAAMADALESNDPPDLRRLVQTAPSHGFQRFMQQYDLVDLFAEERVLRRVIVSRVEEGLGRQCRPDEAAALHAMIDIMLQQGVLALVQQQNQELVRAAEVQLKYLSFLSHDLSNNFFVITSHIEFIEKQLSTLPEMRETSEVLGAALETARRTRDGMRQLLEHERLRKSEARLRTAPVHLREVVEPIVRVAASEARTKGLRIDIDIDPGATAETEATLLTIILQNLIGNAVKHAAGVGGAAGAASGAGSVRVGAERRDKDGKDSWIVSVSDDGPGIPEDELDRLFKAFERLPQPGEKVMADEGGFGLGLAIASQAARLLGTAIEVKTELGRGSRFSFRVPAFRPVPNSESPRE